MSDPSSVERELTELRSAFQRLRARVEQRFVGQTVVFDELSWTLFAGGHALLEGAPGLGKTTLVRALADALELDFGRVQCTPDLMPNDVLGTRILEEGERGSRTLRFEKGPIFAHVVLMDEINRATPRTQSALLEAMAERQVTVYGETHVLEAPFFVVATQNPIEMEGTYPLPEAQLDRFLAKIDVPSPGLAELETILALDTAHGAPLATREAPVLSRARLVRAIELVRSVPVARESIAQVARLIRATHPTDPLAGERVRVDVRYGASPRGGLAVLALARARALLAGRVSVAPEDLSAVARCALRHRLILSFEGEAALARADELVSEAFERSLPTRR